MSTRFRDAVVLTYAFPEETLRSLVPPALQLETHDGVAFVAVAVVDMQRLRPSGRPGGQEQTGSSSATACSYAPSSRTGAYAGA